MMKCSPSVAILQVLLLSSSLCGCASAGADPADPNVASGKKALFVMNTSKAEFNTKSRLPPTPDQLAGAQARRSDDEKHMDFLRKLGFEVTTADDQTSVSQAEGMDLIVISESIRGQAIMDRYRNVRIPVVVNDPDILDDMGMTGQALDRDFGTDTPARYIDMVNAPHPLSAGLSGVISVFSAGTYEINWGKPANGATYIAHLHGYPDKWTVFAYEKGATMYGDFVAPARRVASWIFEGRFQDLSPDGLTLYAAMLAWAVAPPPPYVPLRTGEFFEHPDIAPPRTH